MIKPETQKVYDELMLHFPKFWWAPSEDMVYLLKEYRNRHLLLQIHITSKSYEILPILISANDYEEWLNYKGNLKERWFDDLKTILKTMYMSNNLFTTEESTTEVETTGVLVKGFYALKNYSYKTVNYVLEQIKEKIEAITSITVTDKPDRTIYELGDERLVISKPLDLDSNYTPKNPIKSKGVIDWLTENGHSNCALMTLFYTNEEEGQAYKNNLHLLKKEAESKPVKVETSSSSSIVKLDSIKTKLSVREFVKFLVEEFTEGLTFEQFVRLDYVKDVETSIEGKLQFSYADFLITVERIFNDGKYETTLVHLTGNKVDERHFTTNVLKSTLFIVNVKADTL